jgi:hypothetical protein
MRLYETHEFVARPSSLFLPHTLGVFAFNSASAVYEKVLYEDFIAIPDLASGMLSDVFSHHVDLKISNNKKYFPAIDEECMSVKSNILSEWFWHLGSSLLKTCIVIDKEEKKMAIRKIDRIDPLISS